MKDNLEELDHNLITTLILCTTFLLENTLDGSVLNDFMVWLAGKLNENKTLI